MGLLRMFKSWRRKILMCDIWKTIILCLVSLSFLLHIFVLFIFCHLFTYFDFCLHFTHFSAIKTNFQLKFLKIRIITVMLHRVTWAECLIEFELLDPLGHVAKHQRTVLCFPGVQTPLRPNADTQPVERIRLVSMHFTTSSSARSLLTFVYRAERWLRLSATWHAALRWVLWTMCFYLDERKGQGK